MNLHHKTISKKLGKRPQRTVCQQSARRALINKALEVVEDREFVHRWFDAETFFGTEYLTGLLKGQYFITCDRWMSSEIYSVKQVDQHGIRTVHGPLDSLEQAKQFVRNKTKDTER